MSHDERGTIFGHAQLGHVEPAHELCRLCGVRKPRCKKPGCPWDDMDDTGPSPMDNEDAAPQVRT